jgi:hypothetical protein
MGGLLIGFVAQLNAIAALFLLRAYNRVKKQIREADKVYLEEATDLFAFVEEK